MQDIRQKPHYVSLDALRGVAALVVVTYHVFECFDQSLSPAPHGYLAVDFFFVLSGFVIGYAYDDRWQKGLGIGNFVRRRLIRLHPMVVAGALIGAATYIIGGRQMWDGTVVSLGWIMLALLCGMFLIPIIPNTHTDVRGYREMFPLNGPTWSLFFEYIGNIFYALLLRRMPTRWLAALTVVLGAMLTYIAVSSGALGVGWTLNDNGFWWGLVRMLFPYCMGMLLARRNLKRQDSKREWKSGNTWTFFLLASLLIIFIACVPLIKSAWLNGLFEVFCIIVLFPLIIYKGSLASATNTDDNSSKSQFMKHLGELSYPLYAVHYPFMYLFYIPIIGGTVTSISQVWLQALLTVGASLLTAWLLLYFYDRPLRRWLSRKV